MEGSRVKVHLYGGPLQGRMTEINYKPDAGDYLKVTCSFYSPELQKELIRKVYGIKILNQLLQAGELVFETYDTLVYGFDGDTYCSDGDPVFVYINDLEVP